jgi:tetratricopeptide (TPR) repeat protein
MHQEAIKCYDEALRLNPRLEQAWSNKGVALYYLKQYTEALKCAEQALKINPNDTNVHKLKQICLEQLRK